MDKMSFRDLVVRDFNGRLYLLQRVALGKVPVQRFDPDPDFADGIIMQLADGRALRGEILEEADQIVICFENCGLEMVIAKNDVWSKPN